MRVSSILEAKAEAIRFLKRIKEVEESEANKDKFGKSSNEITYQSKQTGALRRASMDLTRALAKMRSNPYR